MCTMSVDGRRVYVRTPYGHPLVARLKALGAHWDRDRKQWWIGVGKRAEVEALLASAENATDAPKPKLADDARVYAKVSYKGRTYYVIGETADRCRLTVLDGSIDFWADKSACDLIKDYKPREVWDGRRYSGRTVTRYTTLGSIRDFIAEAKAAEKQIAAGEVPDGYAVDREDGCVKRISECDMPDRGSY